MHVARVPSRQNGREYACWLLRRSFREGGKVKHQTLANLTPLPPAAIEAVRAVLRGESMDLGKMDWTIERSRPHGHVAAVLGLLRQLGLEMLLDRSPSRQRDLCVAMIVARLLEASSKLALSRCWSQSTLGSVLGVEDADEDELYGAMDWLLQRQERIEKKLARRHLGEGSLVLYDLSSSYVEGRHCVLAKRGYSRDGKKGTLQIEYGLITDMEGRPIAVETVAGNTGDPATVVAQVEKLKETFGLGEVILVGDRGMLTSTQISVLRDRGVGWISALRSPAISKLIEGGVLQLSLFDERNLAEIAAPGFPGERLVVCRNPALATERARKREDLLRATEAKLAPIVNRVRSGKLVGAGEIGQRVGKVINQHKVAKHFAVEIGDASLTITRKDQQIAEEAALDGIYVLRTSVPSEKLDGPQVVRAYKLLVRVERAFRSFKAVDLQVRPIRHWAENRVRAHIFLCMLAYYVQWHLERAWAPLLFRDEERPFQADPVLPAQRSAGATRKAETQRLEDGTAAHSLRTLLHEMATLTRNRVTAGGPAGGTFEMLATATPLQSRAFDLLKLSPSRL